MKRKEFIEYCILLICAIMSIPIGSDVMHHMENVKTSYSASVIRGSAPFGSGRAADLAARSIEKYELKYFGYPIVTTSKASRGETFKWSELVKYSPNNYTIGIMNASTLLQSFYKITSYYHPSTLAPPAKIISVSQAIANLGDKSRKNINEFVEYAKRHSDDLTFARNDLGTTLRQVAKLLDAETKIKLSHAYLAEKTNSLTILLDHKIQVISSYLSAIQEYAKSGGVRAYAIAVEEKSADMINKNLQSFKEQAHYLALNNRLYVTAHALISERVKSYKQLSTGLVSAANTLEFKTFIADVRVSVDCEGIDNFREKWFNRKSVGLAES